MGKTRLVACNAVMGLLRPAAGSDRGVRRRSCWRSIRTGSPGPVFGYGRMAGASGARSRSMSICGLPWRRRGSRPGRSSAYTNFFPGARRQAPKQWLAIVGRRAADAGDRSGTSRQFRGSSSWTSRPRGLHPSSSSSSPGPQAPHGERRTVDPPHRAEPRGGDRSVVPHRHHDQRPHRARISSAELTADVDFSTGSRHGPPRGGGSRGRGDRRGGTRGMLATRVFAVQRMAVMPRMYPLAHERGSLSGRSAPTRWSAGNPLAEAKRAARSEPRGKRRTSSRRDQSLPVAHLPDATPKWPGPSTPGPRTSPT